MNDRTRLKTATTVWIALLAVAAFGAEQIAELDPPIMIVAMVLITTAMFTCMQIMIRETLGGNRPKEYVGSREVPRTPLQKMIVRNLIVSASIFAILWASGALPVG